MTSQNEIDPFAFVPVNANEDVNKKRTTAVTATSNIMTTNKKKFKPTLPLDLLPLELIVEAVRFLPVRAAANLLLTCHDIHDAVTTCAYTSERWWSNLLTTNHPSLLHLSHHPSLNTSMKKLSSYVKSCPQTTSKNGSRQWREQNPTPLLDLNHILVHCEVYVKVSESVDETVQCETCTLINAFGSSACAACHQQIDYTNRGKEEILFQTIACLKVDTADFTYPPIDSSTHRKIEDILLRSILFCHPDDAAPTHTEIQLRMCLFDTKSGRTFGQYNGSVEDMEDECTLYFTSQNLILSNTLSPHLKTFLDNLCLLPCICFGAGDTTGQLTVFGEHDEVQNRDAAVKLLYLFTQSVDWSDVPEVPEWSHAIVDWSNAEKIERGSHELFLLPNEAAPESAAAAATNQVETIRSAKVALAQMANDVTFLISIHRYAGHLSLGGTTLYHNELLASYDETSEEHELTFVLQDFDSTVIQNEDFVIEIVAVNMKTNRMCQLVKHTSHYLNDDENRNESSSEHMISHSAIGRTLKEARDYEYTCALRILMNEVGEFQLKYQVVDRLCGESDEEGFPQGVVVLNAFLQMSFDEGGEEF